MKMIQIATDPSQSERLTDCGVSYFTADMTLSYSKGYYELMATPFHYGCFDEKDLPAWSLSSLLALLPKEISDKYYHFSYYLSLAMEMAVSDDYRVSYKPCYSDDEELMYMSSPNPIEACVQMIEWLTANKYKLNENPPKI